MEKVMNVKKNLKRALALAVTPFVFGASAYAEETVSLTVNGETIESEGYVSDGKIYVSLSDIAESFGATYSWDEETNSVNVEQNPTAIVEKTIAEANESIVTILSVTTTWHYGTMQYYDETYNALGSGVVIKSNGVILTNNHVVDDAEKLTVILSTGERCGASLMYADEKADVAVIKINKLGLRPITFADADSLAVGQGVIAIGSPQSVEERNTATYGIISGLDINFGGYYRYLRTDAAINSGNSGGALINLKGELVGINTLVRIDTDNMGYAVPIDTIKYVLNNFEKYGKVFRPEIGAEISESWESKRGISTIKGLIVTASENPSFEVGDVITAVNGYSVSNIVDYHEAIKKTYDGGDITFTYTRDGASYSVTVTPTNIWEITE